MVPETDRDRQRGEEVSLTCCKEGGTIEKSEANEAVVEGDGSFFRIA
jgi:hypothetical protein